jgi:L-rhamnose mutarotase
MGRAIFRMRVKTGQETVYRDRHQNVWPEVLEACRRAGMRRYSIFMAGPELIAYFEADDPAEALTRLGADPVMHRWWAYMDPVMDVEPSDAHAYVEVFHLD